MGLARATSFAILWGLLIGCGSVARQIEADVAAAQDDVHRRSGADLGVEAREAFVASRWKDGLAEEDCAEVALALHPAWTRRLAELSIASAELVEVGRLRNPILGASAKFFDDGTEFELSLVQPWIDLWTRPARRAQARAALDAAAAESVLEGLRIAFDAKRAHAEAIATQAVLALEEQRAELERRADELNERLHSVGNLDARDRARSRERVASAELERLRAAADAGEALARLDQALGRAADAGALTLVDGPSAAMGAEPEALTEVIARARAASLELAMARARVEQRRAALDGVAARSALGDASLGVTGQRTSDSDVGVGPALELGLPLFDAGGAPKARSEAQLAEARESLVEREHALAFAVRRALERGRDARAILASLESVSLPALAESVTQELRHFNAMQIDAFAVLRTRAEELHAQRAAVEARRDASLARIDLEELLAGGSTPLASPSPGPDARRRRSGRDNSTHGHASHE